MIAYADTGFLVSLFGPDSNSAIATALVRSKPVFLLTSLGEAEFTNAVELRVFRKEWTRHEARSVRDLFLQHQAARVFRRRSAPTFGKRLWLSRVIIARSSAPEHSSFSTLQPHLFSSRTSSIRLTNASANLPGSNGCGFFQHERGSPVALNRDGTFLRLLLEGFRLIHRSAKS